MRLIKAVPTNIITGALGVGKTSIIKQLLKSKPANERWAVLVNEFGEIGIDGALLTRTFSKADTQNDDSQTIFVREVPGGCMCCASGLPMQIVLNQLLATAKPHRLLIEPTGLGHPKELIEVLGSEYYKDVIRLDTILCLIDARKVSNPKWRTHQTFQDQVQVADLIVATKNDLYDTQDMPQLMAYLNQIWATSELEPRHIKVAMDGEVSREIIGLLCNPTDSIMHAKKAPKRLSLSRPNQASNQAIAQQVTNKLIKATNSGDGYYSCGWIWSSDHWFDYEEVIQLFNSIEVVLLKGLLITQKGIFGFNGQAGEFDISEYDEASESRLEIIADSEPAALNAAELIERILCVQSE